MGLNRALAIAGALLALLAVAGCGLGPGEGLDPVRLTVTHDYGRELVLAEEVEDATEADTVMRVLEGAAEIGTKEGGRFVKAIDGARRLRLPWPGHSGGTAPASHRTSLDHRPYVRRRVYSSIPDQFSSKRAFRSARLPPL